MDLISAAEKLSSGDHFPVDFAATSCLHSLNKLASCEACFAVCPTSAIQSGKPPSLDPQSCVACRACLQACPVGAFSGEDQVKHLLASAARAIEKHNVKQIDVLCQRHTSPARGPAGSQLGLRLQGCLAQLGVGAYLGLAVLGVEKVTVRLEDCLQCPLGMLKDRIGEQTDQAITFLKSCAQSSVINVQETSSEQNLQDRPGWNADSPLLSRAELLRPSALLIQAKYEPLISPDASGVSKQQLSLDRYRQIFAVKELVKGEQPAPEDPMISMNYVRAVVNDACTGCNVCSQACPTRALKRTVIEEKEFKLGFFPLKCVDCKGCVELCPEDAITLERPVPVGYLLEGEWVVYQGSLVKCQRCGTLFSPKAEEKLCPTCQYRRDNPFGSRWPKTKPS